MSLHNIYSRGHVEEKELWDITDGNVKCYSYYKKQPANSYKIDLFIHISPNNFIAGNSAITLRALVHKHVDSRHLLQHDYCRGKILEAKLNI